MPFPVQCEVHLHCLPPPRAELVAYYGELSREAERRRMRAEWQGRRLELSQERQRFLQREREELEREEREREELGREEGEREVEVKADPEPPVECQEAVHTTQQPGELLLSSLSATCLFVVVKQLMLVTMVTIHGCQEVLRN